MRRLAFIVFLVLSPASAFAQQVVVRSGEHGAFTRLVLTVPEGTQYDLSQLRNSRDIRISLSTPGLDFDTSSVFDKINTNRIAAITPVEGRSALDVSLNCSCVAKTFTLRGTMIVVDLQEGDPGSTELASQETSSLSAAPAIRTPTRDELALARDLSTVRVEGLPGIGPDRRAEPLLPSVGILRPERVQDTLAGQGESKPYELGGAIAASLAKAATEGLLEPAISAAPQAADIVLQPTQTDESHDQAAGVVEDLARQLTELSPESDEKGYISVGAGACTPDKAVHISDWSSADSVNGVLSERRNQLFGEFDVVNENAVNAYARELLFFGFGAEARSALLALPEGPDPVLNSISYLVDGEQDPTGWFRSQADCEGFAAFWAALSGGVKRGNAHYNSAGILRGLENLPTHLRDYLGPLLAQRLSSEGKSELARDVLRRLERLHGGPTDSLALNAAEIEMRDGNVDKAESTLKSINALPESEAYRAVTTSVDIAHARNVPVSEEVVALTAAYASELRDSEMGPDLWKAHLRTLLLNDRFSESFKVLEDAGAAPAEIQKEMLSETVRAVTQRADDLEFLKYAMGGALDTSGMHDTALELAIVRRLTELGMPDMALDRLDKEPQARENRDFRLARAKALMALSRPEEAEITLVGLRGEEIDALRADARRGMGDYSYARELYDGMGRGDDALQSAWLSGDWERVAKDTDTPLGQAAQLLNADGPAPESPTLTYAETLSGNAAETRETLRALLEATRIGAGG
ncbi:hypothetical protein [Tropicibacter sp. S64]|uniref:hypothetical protein n=1 Tax=Tropicibacter sp. S64 TaxID=3415122 RepID=UPI003C7D1EF6